MLKQNKKHKRAIFEYGVITNTLKHVRHNIYFTILWKRELNVNLYHTSWISACVVVCEFRVVDNLGIVVKVGLVVLSRTFSAKI